MEPKLYCFKVTFCDDTGYTVAQHDFRASSLKSVYADIDEWLEANPDIQKKAESFSVKQLD